MADANQLAQSPSLLPAMLNTLFSASPSQFPKFVSLLMQLAMTNCILFQPHLQPLLELLAPIITNGSILTPKGANAKPMPNSGVPSSIETCVSSGADIADTEMSKEIMRKALEFMITLSEANPGMVKNVGGWSPAIVTGCLEGMASRDDDLDKWLEADVRLFIFPPASWGQ